MKFRYIGEEHPTVFGLDWHKGVVHDVTDAHAVKKLTINCFFERVVSAEEPCKAPVVASPVALEAALDAVEIPQMPKKRGPKPKLPEAE